MSTNIDTMMFVGEVPWHNLGHQITEPMRTSKDIVISAHLDWSVNIEKMYTQSFADVPNYNVVYREDTKTILGVLNKQYPELVQNIDAFNAFEGLLGTEVEVETVASLGRGEQVFGCFKVNEGYTMLDEKIDHYFVVLNEHTKSDGKVTILNTPIRVVCQNTLSSALSNAVYKTRVPVVDGNYNIEIARKIIESKDAAADNLNRRAMEMYNKKVSRDHVEAMLDELFPMIISESDESLHTKQNMKIELMRDTFVGDCLGADNLGNYRNTQLAVYNALTDFEQHYYSKLDNSYELNYRMKVLPGVAQDSSRILSMKYLKIANKLVA